MTVYLDHNATTPMCDEAIVAMERARRDGWGNPSSVHAAGRQARRYLDDARTEVAALAGVSERDVVFTSGGTEANNLALRRLPAATLVASPLDHPSIVATARTLELEGRRVIWLPTRGDGVIDLESVRAALETSARPCLVATHAVHHETGVIQPVAALIELAHSSGAQIHVDAVQAAGRVDAALWHGADTIAIASHKLRGPKGIGALVHRPGRGPTPILRGGAQERGLRPGTQDAIAAAGFSAAARRAAKVGPSLYVALAPLRDRLESAAIAAGARRTTAARRAPHVAHLIVPAVPGDELVAALDLEGICVSSGSACTAGTAEPSAAISAMLGAAAAAHSLRVSLGETSVDADVDHFIEALIRVLSRSRRDLSLIT